jgi:hypothetical protein
MGGNRKNRQSSTTTAIASKLPLQQTLNSTAYESNSKELLEAVEEVNRFSFRISIAELTILMVFFLSFVLSAFLLAMAAEMSISIQSFDKPARPVFKDLDIREQELNLYRFRTTLAEQDTSAYNAVQHDVNQKYRLQRVIHIEPSGHPKAMLVVEDSVMEQVEGSSSNARLKYDGNYISKSESKMRPPFSDALTRSTFHPKLCSDGTTWGFDSWDSLNDAVIEANILSVEKYVQWSRFFADVDFSGTFQDDHLYYEEELVFKICPGTKLRAKQGPIFINTPNLIVECEGCVVSVGASHLSFGPNAKNVMIRGFTFTKAWSSSLLFFHNGAEVAFEDCLWYDNAAVNSRFGAVADINSTCNVNFYRCNIGRDQRGENDLASSLSIRV